LDQSCRRSGEKSIGIVREMPENVSGTRENRLPRQQRTETPSAALQCNRSHGTNRDHQPRNTRITRNESQRDHKLPFSCLYLTCVFSCISCISWSTKHRANHQPRNTRITRNETQRHHKFPFSCLYLTCIFSCISCIPWSNQTPC
jgi:hypothetical protein